MRTSSLNVAAAVMLATALGVAACASPTQQASNLSVNSSDAGAAHSVLGDSEAGGLGSKAVPLDGADLPLSPNGTEAPGYNLGGIY